MIAAHAGEISARGGMPSPHAGTLSACVGMIPTCAGMVAACAGSLATRRQDHRSVRWKLSSVRWNLSRTRWNRPSARRKRSDARRNCPCALRKVESLAAQVVGQPASRGLPCLRVGKVRAGLAFERLPYKCRCISDYLPRPLLAARRTGALWACCLRPFADMSSARNSVRFVLWFGGVWPEARLRICFGMEHGRSPAAACPSQSRHQAL